MRVRHQSNKEQETDERIEKWGGLQIDQIRPKRNRFASKLGTYEIQLSTNQSPRNHRRVFTQTLGNQDYSPEQKWGKAKNTGTENHKHEN
jgi:hypothetical protein